MKGAIHTISGVTLTQSQPAAGVQALGSIR